MAPELPKPPRTTGMRYAGLGMELAGGIGGFTLLGYWLDLKLGTHPRWLTVGAVLGCVGGMYNLIKIGISESKRAQTPSSKAATDQTGEQEKNPTNDGNNS